MTDIVTEMIFWAVAGLALHAALRRHNQGPVVSHYKNHKYPSSNSLCLTCMLGEGIFTLCLQQTLPREGFATPSMTHTPRAHPRTSHLGSSWFPYYWGELELVPGAAVTMLQAELLSDSKFQVMQPRGNLYIFSLLETWRILLQAGSLPR